MRELRVRVGEKDLALCELSAAQAVAVEREGQLLYHRLCAQGIPEQAAHCLGHNAALCAYSLRENGGRLFYSAQGCLGGITLAELAHCAKQYKDQFMTEQGGFDECGINRSLQTGGDGHGAV